MTDRNVDPITFAVIKNGLDTIVDDMAYTVMRTARSPIVRDVLDFSATLCDARGRILAQAKTVALHLGSVPDAMDVILAEYGDDLHDGDIIILNDPYAGGMHLPDIFMFKPIFRRYLAGLRRGDRASFGRGWPGAGFECIRLDRDISGRFAHTAAEIIRRRPT